MISPRLVRELRTAIARHKYEVMEDGNLFFVESKLQGGGIFEVSFNLGPWEIQPNILPKEGRNMMLDVAFGGVGAQAAWYMAPFSGNVTPVDTLTAATFNSAQTEFTNYTETTRSLWTPAAAVDGVVTNAATPITITIGSGTGSSNTTIRGLGFLSASAKLSTSGKLGACTFLKDGNGDPKPRLNLVEGDLLGLRYTNTLTST